MQENITRLVAALREYTTTELCDGGADRVMDYRIKPLTGSARICGPAYTVDTPVNISGLVPDAFDDIRPGEVLVIGGHGSCIGSYWGDYRSYCARQLGVEAIVVDGAIRDIDECISIGVPIYAIGVIPHSAGKGREGTLNVPITCGGITVRPGDLIVGDNNGVLAIAPEDAEAIMAAAQRKKDAEALCMQQMQETGVIIPRVKVSKAPQ